jgi:hypothetical protein
MIPKESVITTAVGSSEGAYLTWSELAVSLETSVTKFILGFLPF